jgi:hypothetical protein
MEASVDFEDIIRTATGELEEEAFRERVEAAKVRLRDQMRRPWWRRVFPYSIQIKRID